MKNRKTYKAFTLVELLIVISIIGILAGLVLPSVWGMLFEGDRTKSLNAAKQIATAWQKYTTSGGQQKRTVNAKDIHDWAFRLAEKADLNEPTLWILDVDPKVAEKIGAGATMPANIGDKIGNEWKISEEFKSFPLSWEVANKIPPNAKGHTPIIWTRGLKANGDWDKEIGVFGDRGGHIAFV
ncbi:MAG: type II secretion system protein, partial [Opitutales bacterium]|nr:type II secretion system protein [Opitutales bacterium]